MKRICLLLAVVMLAGACDSGPPDTHTADIPLPEHPRPDFMRDRWLNLNGTWEFTLDSLDVGLDRGWPAGDAAFGDSIVVPFSWAAPLSDVGVDDVHVGWYARDIMAPRGWDGQRVHLVIGASDFGTTVWVNGEEAGRHDGGYTPFSFDITDLLEDGRRGRLVIRVEDRQVDGRPVGKQVYGNAKGIWQTVYLEARPDLHVVRAHCTPDIDSGITTFDIALSGPSPAGYTVSAEYADRSVGTVTEDIPVAGRDVAFETRIPEPRLWTLDDPHLYDVDIVLRRNGSEIDRVHTYYGMRKIGMGLRPGSEDMYVTLNGEPVYLQMALDQAYHPGGYYTFPSDEFMRAEIERAKDIGLNGIRIHIKTEMPRKLYWADRLGLLVMADFPNFWGPADEHARTNWEYVAERQIERDYNHPAIFSWVLFNESWGLSQRRETPDGGSVNVYPDSTRQWVKGLYAWAKEKDPTRLVEDNSPDPNRRWHIATDINSWHVYLPAYEWAPYMDMVVENTYPGSPWNYVEPHVQDYVPMMNSECGNVWGYAGGTGDIDLSYEYHIMLNEFRRRPKISGFIFTEFHDVINEWNGYYRFDRSLKDFGLSELCPGMTVSDFHAPLYLIPGVDFKQTVPPGENFAVSLTASFLGSEQPEHPGVQWVFHGWNSFGEHTEWSRRSFGLDALPWRVTSLPSIQLTAPDEPTLGILCTYLIDENEVIHHRNFVPVRIADGPLPRMEQRDGDLVMRTAPGTFEESRWSVTQTSVMGGRKVWGTGTGHFTYVFPWPEGISADDVEGVTFLAECSARRIQGKDMDDDYVGQSIGNVSARGIDPGHNPNSYPMTDDSTHPGTVTLTLNGRSPVVAQLPDDPADHRGILSWLSQNEDRRLHEAGSYGYRVEASFDGQAIRAAHEEGVLRVRLAVDEAGTGYGGLAVYGEEFGRYPMDPTVVIRMR